MYSCDCNPIIRDNERYFNNLRQHFKHDGLDFNNFCKILQESKAIISGGTILSVMNSDESERYIIPDVDIYVNQSNSNVLLNHLDTVFNYSHIPLKNSKGNNYHYKFECKNTKDTEYMGKFKNIVELYNYTCRVKVTHSDFEIMSYVRPYQVIVIDDSISVQDFVSKFDLTFCQNFFDGKQFFSYHPDCVSSKRGFITRYIDIDYLYRIEKYEKRGYTIVNKNDKNMVYK